MANFDFKKSNQSSNDKVQMLNVKSSLLMAKSEVWMVWSGSSEKVYILKDADRKWRKVWWGKSLEYSGSGGDD